MIENFNIENEQKNQTNPVQELKKFLQKHKTISQRKNQAKRAYDTAKKAYEKIIKEEQEIEAKLANFASIKI